MRKKSKKQIDNERKEQGFSIYVSGANAGRKQQRGSSRNEESMDSPEPATERQRLKTAGGNLKTKCSAYNDFNSL